MQSQLLLLKSFLASTFKYKLIISRGSCTSMKLLAKMPTKVIVSFLASAAQGNVMQILLLLSGTSP